MGGEFLLASALAAIHPITLLEALLRLGLQDTLLACAGWGNPSGAGDSLGQIYFSLPKSSLQWFSESCGVYNGILLRTLPSCDRKWLSNPTCWSWLRVWHATCSDEVSLCWCDRHRIFRWGGRMAIPVPWYIDILWYDIHHLPGPIPQVCSLQCVTIRCPGAELNVQQICTRPHSKRRYLQNGMMQG